MVVWYAGLITLVGVIIAVAIMIWIAFRQNPAKQTQKAKHQIYRARYWYILILICVFVFLLTFTLTYLPYYQNRQANPNLAVSVTGRMWNWELASIDNRPENVLTRSSNGELILPVHKIIEFRVTAKDVNHGFGIYDLNGHLLAQTQAMPGYINRLVYTFDEPGEYTVLCLEYCGMAHHMMQTQFRVE